MDWHTVYGNNNVLFMWGAPGSSEFASQAESFSANKVSWITSNYYVVTTFCHFALVSCCPCCCAAATSAAVHSLPPDLHKNFYYQMCKCWLIRL